MKTISTPSLVGPKEFIALMALLMSIVAISIDAMVPALATIGTDLNATSANQAQYIIIFIFCGMALGQLVCGPLSDAIGRKRIISATILLYLIGSLVCLFSESMSVMLFGRFLQGLGVSGPYVAAISVVRDKFHGRQMARIMSLVMMIFIMVPALAPGIGQGILYLASWRAIFAFYIVYSLTIILWVGFRLEETLPPEKRIPFSTKNILRGVHKVFSNHQALCYMVCMGFVFGGLMGYLSSCQQIFQELYHTGDYFALYFGGLALTFGASSLVNSKLVEKVGMRPLCRRAILINIGVSAVFLAINLFMLPPLWMFLLYAAIIFFNFGMLFGNLNALAMEPMGHIAGLASAIIGAFSSVLSLVAGTLIGQFYNGTLIPIVGGFLILGLCSLTAFYHADRPLKKKDELPA